MRLVASMIVDEQVEKHRYLDACLAHLGEFCDAVAILRDGTDGVDFFAHEGRARQRLLDLTLSMEPTHVLAIDADEFVADGPTLRSGIEAHPERVSFNLTMQEVWEAGADGLCIREDGGWRSHPIPALWKVPARLDSSWRIADRALACGRVPHAIDRAVAHLGNFTDSVSDLLHFGWANEADRDRRFNRYLEHDGGRFHASTHLQSILWPCERIQLRPREWPSGLAGQRSAIMRAASRWVCATCGTEWLDDPVAPGTHGCPECGTVAA